MMHALRAIGSLVPTASLIACLWALTLAPPAFANEVVQWNETTMKAIVANGQNNIVATRTLAMVQAAVHDALERHRSPLRRLLLRGARDPAASPDAAVAAAAHTVLVGVVGGFGTPAQKGATFALVDQAYAASMARVTDGPARNKGVAVGRAAGAAMLALRKDDGASRDAPYTPGMGPGKWQPHPNPVPPQSAHRQPGPRPRLRALGRFRAGRTSPLSRCCPPRSSGFRPPALTSATYARDYNEVEEHRRQGQHDPHGRPDPDRALLVRGARHLEHDRAHGGHRSAASTLATPPGSSPS